ncbi:MAG: xanthine dehydrogenase small subunit, partial [Gammaproteobacteria bacterium]
DPTRTVLQFLREDLGKTGSKEGCAEGDCGACTIVIAELIDSNLQFRAVNACIQFLPTLQGKAIFTVESLRLPDGELHPVQKALVDCHASQCGFCTPGFAMSMFVLYQDLAGTGNRPSRVMIDDCLSGNLCRCTGYKPIIEACDRMFDYEEPVDREVWQDSLKEKLNSIQQPDNDSGHRTFISPDSISDLSAEILSNPQACLLAGGTDVGLWVTKQHRQLDHLIYLGQVEALKQIEETSKGFEIGAAVTLEDAFEVLRKPFPEFDELFRRFASLPIRNAGTLVGNIANGSPIGDSMPALICLDARVKLRKGDEIRELALEDFYLDYQKKDLKPGEWIQSVIIPSRDQSCLIRSYKVCKRFDQDISAVCSAFVLRLDGSRVESIKIAYGGMAAIPKRAQTVEAQLVGSEWNSDQVNLGMKAFTSDFQPLTDMRASQSYRSRVAANLLMRFYLDTIDADNNELQVFGDLA